MEAGEIIYQMTIPILDQVEDFNKRLLLVGLIFPETWRLQYKVKK